MAYAISKANKETQTVLLLLIMMPTDGYPDPGLRLDGHPQQQRPAQRPAAGSWAL